MSVIRNNDFLRRQSFPAQKESSVSLRSLPFCPSEGQNRQFSTCVLHGVKQATCCPAGDMVYTVGTTPRDVEVVECYLYCSGHGTRCQTRLNKGLIQVLAATINDNLCCRSGVRLLQVVHQRQDKKLMLRASQLLYIGV